MKAKVVLLPGDGIGAEVMDAAVAVMEHLAGAFNVDLQLTSMLVGGALDFLVRIPGLRLDQPLGSLVCGGLAHLTKFAFITAYAMSFGLYRNFLEIGMFTTAGLYLFFGALGGLAGFVAITGVRRLGERRR